jgi:hypothetical protein
MVKHLFGAWLLYWAVVAMLPVHSLYPATLAAFLLQLAFVVLVASTYAGVTTLRGLRNPVHAGVAPVPRSRTIIRVAFVMSIIGLAALTYDKLFIQGIDYSEGVAVAREEWRRLGEEREGAASSLLSAIGYLFGSAYFVALVLALTQVRELTARERMAALVGCFALLIGNSALTGGRSNVLLFAAFALASFSARRGLRLGGLLHSRWQRTVLKGLAVAAVAYTVYIFYERARAGGESALFYAIDFLPFLGVEANRGWRESLSDDALGSLQAMLVLAGSYVAHSFATMAAIVDAPSEDKTIVFLHLAGILAKLGIVGPPDGDWFLSGRFPSLPGAFLHQFGVLGLAVASVLLGAMAGAAAIWTARSPRSLIALGTAVMADVVLLLSPALFAADFLSFPFVVSAFLILGLLAQARRPRRLGRTRIHLAPLRHP